MQTDVFHMVRRGLITNKTMREIETAEQAHMCFVVFANKGDSIYSLLFILIDTNILLTTIMTQNKTKKRGRVYTKDDYNSGDGMQTAIWGPAIWHFLHTISFNYSVKPSKEDKMNYRNFVLNLKNILPCKFCRINLANNFKTNPLQMRHMANRETFSRYIYELHETVNKMLHKIVNLSYSEVRDRYEHFRSRCTDIKPTVTAIPSKTKTQKHLRRTMKQTRKRKPRETGCTVPLYGEKAKCVINIVPQNENIASFQMDKKFEKKR
jgi:hypothetical protein